MAERKKRRAQYSRIWVAEKRSTSLVRVDAQSSLSDSDSDEFVLEGEEIVANVQTNEATLGGDSVEENAEPHTGRDGDGPMWDLIDAPVFNFSSDEEDDENL